MEKIIFILLAIVLISTSLCLYYENEKLKVELDHCCIGTWISSQNGQGYSGPREDIDDVPASPMTGRACY